VTPLVYSVPEALLVGELASMLPLEGGYYQWVKRAFGRFWGFWNGWLSWSYSLLDMAIYPVLLLQYLRFFAPDLSPLASWLVAVGMIWIATGLNLRGSASGGDGLGFFATMVLAPFGVVIAIACARWLFPSSDAVVAAQPFHAAGTSFVGALGWACRRRSGITADGTTPRRSVARSTTRARRTRVPWRARYPLIALIYLVAVIPVLAVTNWESWSDGAWPCWRRRSAGRGWGRGSPPPACSRRSHCSTPCCLRIRASPS
jgi:amino acid transporter